MKTGTFIVIEGGEGSGKSSCIEHLQNKLSKRKDIIFTREPGGTEIGEKIRAVLMDEDNTEMDALTELFLFCGARAQLVMELIRPTLKKGGHIICDRFEASTLAYQIYGRCKGELKSPFEMLNNIAKKGLDPDLVIYLDVEPTVGLRRKEKSEEGACTRFDKEKLGFHEMVREGFLDQYSQAEYGWNNWRMVETTHMKEKDVHNKVWEIVKEKLEI